MTTNGVDPGDDDIVVVADGGPLDPAQAADLVARLRAAPDLDAVGTLLPVIDAIKSVDGRGRIVAPVDRADLVTVEAPMAVRKRAVDPVTGEPRPGRVGAL